MKSIAIMQPTFLPWVGYFDMITRVDEFVFLDCVNFNKRSWQQRNRINTANGVKMLTVSVRSKGAQNKQISDIEIAWDTGFAHKHLNTIKQSYGKAPHFDSVFPILENAYHNEPTYLSDLNIDLIEKINNYLDIETPLVRSTLLKPVGNKAFLLANLCQQLNADIYLSAPGSKEYIQKENPFSDYGISLQYHHYEPSSYPQIHSSFLSHLSIIDLMMNCSVSKCSEIMKSGRQSS